MFMSRILFLWCRKKNVKTTERPFQFCLWSVRESATWKFPQCSVRVKKTFLMKLTFFFLIAQNLTVEETKKLQVKFILFMFFFFRYFCFVVVMSCEWKKKKWRTCFMCKGGKLTSKLVFCQLLFCVPDWYSACSESLGCIVCL